MKKNSYCKQQPRVCLFILIGMASKDYSVHSNGQSVTIKSQKIYCVYFEQIRAVFGRSLSRDKNFHINIVVSQCHKYLHYNLIFSDKPSFEYVIRIL